MTIALAIHASDGIVMAADTLETTDYIKGDEHKIVVAGKPQGLSSVGLCGIAGAGDAGYIDACTRWIGQIFTDNETESLSGLIPRFEQYMIQFHRDHVIPFAPYPSDERPGLEMLLGLQRGEQIGILVTDRSTVRQPIRPFITIGMGGDFALMLIRRLHPLLETPTVTQAQVLAAYVVFRTKEHVETCGNYTTIITLHKKSQHGPDIPQPDGSTKRFDSAEFTTRRRTEELEKQFREWAIEEREMMWKRFKDLARPSSP